MSFFKLTPFEVEALYLSIKISVIAVSIIIPPGILAAWLLSAKSFPGKSIVDGLVHMPLVLPPVVTGYILLITMGRKGFLGELLHKYTGVTLAFDWKGAALASAVMAFPLFVRAVRLSMENLDKGLYQAARTLGAAPFRIFYTITLPLITPGILAGSILAFARSLSEFGATITFVSNIPGETRTLPLALYTLTQVPGGEAGAIRLCIISAITALLALMASDIISRKLSKRIKGNS